ncbi:MAG: acetylxylan esterase, partial [Planctomycetota bacterium]|nr:acetylxylan esterase [Planctomycetota bacterium]
AGARTELEAGDLTLVAGKATVSLAASRVGSLLLEVSYANNRGRGGAVCDWPAIQPSADEPVDFDAFWASKIAELTAVPVNAQLERVEVDPEVDYWLITMDNIRGSKIYGQLAMPKKRDGPLPAYLQVQWAGVYGLRHEWVAHQAKRGFLALNIIAHDLPINKDEAFYAELKAGALKDYPAIGFDDREASYFLRMYLSCYRAANYLAMHPDWNGTTLQVAGGSQGGLQAVVTAALHPKVTVVTANVPAGCDHTGDDVGRLPGWPRLLARATDANRAAVHSTSAYFDVVNFARRVQVPTLVGVGLVDMTCPPEGVIAMFNQLQGPKQLVIMPVAGHMNKHGSHKPYYSAMGGWNSAIAAGRDLPIRE